MDDGRLKIAVLIPCFNEERTIEKVVMDFRRVLPGAHIYVYDNNSTDHTARVALSAGAIVKKESSQGKGNVVRRMFADIDADVYLMVDGDDTYDAAAAPNLACILLRQQLDMVMAKRVADEVGAYRPGHRAGNRLLTGLIRFLFRAQFTDILSGYRVFSRRFVKSFPALSRSFETETELTVHGLELQLPMREVSTSYYQRPAGSKSKLRTFQDGLRIVAAIVSLAKDVHPLTFFTFVFVLLCVTSLALAAPVIQNYMETGLVPRLPTATLATGLMLLGFLSLTCGLVLDSVSRGRREAKRLAYLAQSWLRPGVDEQVIIEAIESLRNAPELTRRVDSTVTSQRPASKATGTDVGRRSQQPQR